MGRHAAGNIVRRLRGEPTRPFRYCDYGTLATIGRKAAVAILGPLKLSGYPACLTWPSAHVHFLIGFRDRLVVLVDWAFAYFRFTRFARVVIEPMRGARGAAPR